MFEEYNNSKFYREYRISKILSPCNYKRSRVITPPSSPTDSTVSTVSTSPIILDEQESVYYLLKSFTWSLWVGPLPIHSLPIAGGHENQWLLPKGVSELGRVAKLTCLNEAYFYDWIYKSCGMTLPYHNKLLECTGRVLRSLKGNNIDKIMTRNAYFRSMENSKSNLHEILDSMKTESEVVKAGKISMSGISFRLSKDANLNMKLLKLHTFKNIHVNRMFKYLPPCYNLCIEDGMVAITLENVTRCMNRPIVMDLKMGTRLFGDCADESVIRIKERKAMERSTKTHGFHISGMYIWDKINRLASFLPVNLAHAAKDDLLLLMAFEKFFYLPIGIEIRDRLIGRFILLLNELRLLFQNKLGLVFYGSSLLFVYDSASIDPSITARIYMIDFAHVSIYDGIDEGYLKGLDNLIRLFHILQQVN